MNRSAFNTTALGSGNSLPWITAAATQALRIIGQARVRLTKYGRAAQDLKLATQLRITQRVFGSASQTCKLIGELPIRVWRQSQGAAVGLLRLLGFAKAFRRVRGLDDELLTMRTIATPRQLIAVHMRGEVSMVMGCFGRGTDFYTGPAPEERVLGVVDLRTREISSVRIGG